MEGGGKSKEGNDAHENFVQIGKEKENEGKEKR